MTCCHSNSSEKPSVNTDVKISKGVNNNNNNNNTFSLYNIPLKTKKSRYILFRRKFTRFIWNWYFVKILFENLLTNDIYIVN